MLYLFRGFCPEGQGRRGERQAQADWIGKSDPSHFAVTEVGETLSAASDKCMASIRQYIVNAVAVNISSAEKMTTRQVTRDQLVSVMNDYSSVLMTEARETALPE